jgi:uncharacterized membrane protein YphA (DoxX/SURF4 family)
MKLWIEKASPWLGLVSRLVLGGVLLAAGYFKVITLEKSQMAVRAYELLPIGFANVLGIVLPFTEIVLGLLLIIGAFTRFSAVLGGAIMFIFIVAIASAWARGLTIDCGCFGGGGQVAANETKYLQEIVRDSGLLLLALFLVRYSVTRFSLDKVQNNYGARV